MATFHRMQDDSGREVVRAFVKGAPDQLLARSSTHLDPGLEVADADDDFRERYLAENKRLGEQGLRVLATARKDFDPQTFDAGADLLPLMDGLTLLALVGIVDPPRPQAKAAIAEAHAAGIQVPISAPTASRMKTAPIAVVTPPIAASRISALP
jgi:Ca2+-transporting ATPase